MTRGIRAALAAVLVAGALAGAARAGERRHQLSSVVGEEYFSEDRLEDAGVQKALQVGVVSSLDFGWPVLLALDLLWATNDETKDVSAGFPLAYDTDVSTLDLHLGVRKFFLEDRVARPFVGGGVAWTRLDVQQIQRGSPGPGADFESTVIDDSDYGFGGWVETGFAYVFESTQIGLDIRYSDTSAELEAAGTSGPVELDSGGIRYGVFFGYHW